MNQVLALSQAPVRISRPRFVHPAAEILGERRRHALLRGELVALAVIGRQDSEGRLAEVQRPRQDRLEHRRYVRWRACDHLQDVGGRGLPLQRLLGFVEQPGVLYSDDGLVGEGLGQRDLLFGKWNRLNTAQ